jgi:phage tail protein X
MAAQLVSRASDVRITEINLSQVILSASSSIACIPIISNQGSITPKFFTNPDDFQAEYGTPNPSISNSIQSALNFFTEGNQLWALRVAGSGHLTSCILMYKDITEVTQFRSIGLSDPANTDLSTLVTGTEEAIALFYSSRGPGSYGNKFSRSISNTQVSVPTNPLGTSQNSGGTLASATYTYKVAALSSSGESLASAPITIVVSGLTQPTGSNVLSWDPVDGAIGYRVYGRTTGSNFGLIAQVGGATFGYTDTGAIVPDTSTHAITDPALAASTPEFVVSVWDNTNVYSTALETWTCTLAANVDASGVQTELEDRINPFSQYIQVVSNVAALMDVPQINAIPKTTFSGGASGSAPTSYQIANALQIFKNKQLYNTNIFINAGKADPVIQLALDTLVQNRADSVALLDVPSQNQSYQSAVDYRNLTLNLNSTYSALFCPDLLQADLVNGKQVYIPPSGWAAALCARTDRVANPAYSIAGLNRGLLNVLKARYRYDDGQATTLYNAQVNYTRTFVGQGIALWEQRTLAANFSALSWLSVRRIVNVIKTSLYSFLLYALQEMNTDTVRRQLVNSCDSYLNTLKNADAIYDFKVVCDNTNNTSTTANAGVLVLTVVLIPSIPIHEIQLQVVISKQGVSFSEVLNQVK